MDHTPLKLAQSSRRSTLRRSIVAITAAVALVTTTFVGAQAAQAAQAAPGGMIADFARPLDPGDPGGGGGGGSTPGFESVKPTVSGTTQVDLTLTAVEGTWQKPGPSWTIQFSYQWYRGDDDIVGATGKTYTLQPADIGKSMSVSVMGKLYSANNTFADSIMRTSNATAAIMENQSAPNPLPVAILPSPVKAGVPVTANPGVWPVGTALTYQWFSNSNVLPGATSATYVPSLQDIDKPLKFAVTGNRLGYVATTVTSSPVKVSGDVFIATPAPKLTGSAKAGSTLQASVSGWQPTPDSWNYQWVRNGYLVNGANSAQYRVTSADEGSVLGVIVTGNKPGFTSASAASKTLRVLSSSPFYDVPTSHKFFSDIHWMYRNGISTGVKTPQGLAYQPSTGVSREAMAAFLYRTVGASYKGPANSPFRDVTRGDPFYNEIAWMHAEGLSTGIAQTSGKAKYAPKAKVSREAMAAFIYRLDRATDGSNVASPFQDMRRGDAFYKEIVWMHAEGLSTGVRQPSGKPKYMPKSTVTREAMAAFLNRLDW